MLQQNLTSNKLPVKIIRPSLTIKNNLLSTTKDSGEKSCEHRNENGWCSKIKNQCLSITDLLKN